MIYERIYGLLSSLLQFIIYIKVNGIECFLQKFDVFRKFPRQNRNTFYIFYIPYFQLFK